MADRTRFEDVCLLLESILQVEFTYQRRRIKENFLIFSSGAKNTTIVTRKGKTLPLSSALNDKEVKLIADLVELLAASHYHPLTKAEFERSQKEQFLFNLPMDVNWDSLDKKLFTSYWNSTGERAMLRRQLPDFSDRVLLCYRGVGIAYASDRYINEKIDLLIEYLVVEPFWWLVSKIPFLRRKPPPVAPTFSKRMSSMHRNAKEIERKTLRRVLNSVWKVIKNFPWIIHLQEPTMKEVVLVYRVKYAKKKKVKNAKRSSAKEAKEARLKEILQARNIYVKSFADIPMADAEIIFPDKTVKLKPLSLIQLIATLVAGFFGAILTVFQGGVSLSVVYSALSLVVARCGQVYSSMQQEKAQMMQDMSLMVYEKSRDAQEGVLSMLLEDMAEEQLKEAILAYSLAMLLNKPLLEEELDEACEDFLEEHFGQKMDFAVEDTLPRLLHLGLIQPFVDRYGNTDKFVALNLEDARTALQTRWKTAYKTRAIKFQDATANLIQEEDVPDEQVVAPAATPDEPKAKKDA